MDATAQRQQATIIRAAFRYGLPIALIATVLAVCAGLVPPLRVGIVLLLGVMATVSLTATARPVLAVVAATSAIFVSAWLLRTSIEIRAARATDRVYEPGRYFGIDSYGENAEHIEIRNIVVATGTFTLNTWISAALYHVKSGEVRQLNSFTVGRTPNQFGAPHWIDIRITFALGSRDVPGGRITQLGSVGQSRGGGSGGEAVNDVDPEAARTLPGRFTSGTRRIVFVEGDEHFQVSATMTVEQFAERNEGNYLVVELEVP